MFVDVYIEFFVRLAIKFARRIGTSGWSLLNAIVVSSVRESSFTGCILVVIHYKYRNADQRFDGTFKQPFVNDNFADAYLRRHPGGSAFPVLVSPHNSSCSIPEEGRIVFTRVD
jgi:hypothetical protein